MELRFGLDLRLKKRGIVRIRVKDKHSELYSKEYKTGSARFGLGFELG